MSDTTSEITAKDCLDTALAIQAYLQERAREEVLRTEPPFRYDCRGALKTTDKLVEKLLGIMREDGWEAKRKERECVKPVDSEVTP